MTKYYLIFAFLFAPYLALTTELLDSLKVYRVPSITVTSTNAQEGLNPVPFIRIADTNLIKSHTVMDLPLFISSMPSIITYSQSGNGIGYTTLNMRGFDQRRISVMINGIPQNDPEDHNVYWIDFPDLAENLESIEIQRGAGMNLYGSPAIGGSINMITSNFADKHFAKFQSGLGLQEFGAGESALQAMTSKQLIEFSSGLIDNIAFYGRLSRITSQGYRDRSFAELNSYFFGLARFDEGLSTQINIFGGPLRDALVYNGLPKSQIKDKELRRKNLSYWLYDSSGLSLIQDYSTERRNEEIEEFSQPHFELLNDWQISPEITFKSSLFYYMGEGFFDYDASWADTTLLRLSSKYGFSPMANPANALVRAYVFNKHGGWIPRFVFDYDKLTHTIGGELRFHRSEHWGSTIFAENLPTGFTQDYKIYSYDGIRDIFSLFGRTQWHLSDMLILSGEAQLAYHKYAIDNEKAGNQFTSYLNQNGDLIGNGSEIFAIEYLFLNPKIGLNFNPDENSSAFVLIAFTSREPRMRNLYAADDSYFGAKPQFEAVENQLNQFLFDFDKPLIKAEKMLNFELAYSYRNKSFAIGANAYYMQYFDELVKSGRLDIFGNPIDQNAPKALHMGLELNIAALIAQFSNFRLNIESNITFSKNRISDWDFDTGSEKVSLKDNPIAGFPDFMMNVALNLISKDLFSMISLKYVGSYRTDNFGDLIGSSPAIISYLSSTSSGYYADNKLDAHFVANFYVSYTIQDVPYFKSLRLFTQINNITNELYAPGAEGKEFFPAAERNYYFGFELSL